MKKALSLLTAALITASFSSVSAETTQTEPSEEPSVAYTLKADTNLDGKVTETDFLRYKFYLLGDETMVENNSKNDLNADGKISIHDMFRVRRILDGLDVLWNPDNLPVMDGSTSAIPLEAGFKSRLLGIPYDEAYNMVEHHKTHESFSMLLSGETDMIFTVPISESQQREADEKNIHLNFVPVAKEGFVFIVNKNNPVDSLTQEQIKDIYSGEITNWKDVGGNDEPIIAYQRNKDSGSQNLITQFMGERELMSFVGQKKPASSKPTSPQIETMGKLIRAIIEYDNSEQAIGYSVYSYAAQMYENNSDIKFIAVDGIAPSKDTLADGTYPLISSTYALYTDNAPKRVHDFVNWAISDEGQTCALENGYLPVRDMQLPAMLKPYTKHGTGKPKPEDYQPQYIRAYISDSLNLEKNKAVITFLKDKKLQNIINNDLKKLLSKEELDPSLNTETHVEYTIINGYMSIMVASRNGEKQEYYRNGSFPYKYGTLTYDLKEGKKITNFSDLFYYNTNFVPLLNDILAVTSNYNSKYKKTDFTGITGNIENFTIDSVILPEDNPYFGVSIQLDFERLYNDPNYDSTYYLTDYMVTGEFCDMEDIVDLSAIDLKYSASIYQCYRDEWNIVQAKDDNNERYSRVEGSAFHTSEEIKEFRKAYDKIREQTEENSVFYNTPSRSYLYPTLNVLVAKPDGYSCNYKNMFSSKGDRVYFSDIFGEEFSYLNDNVHDIIISKLENNTVKVYLSHKYEDKWDLELTIDPDHINWDYINPPVKTEMEKAAASETADQHQQ